MDVSKDFIEKIESMAKPEVVEIGDYYYSKDPLVPVIEEPPFRLAEAFGISTLTGLVEYLNGQADGVWVRDLDIIVNVVSPIEINVFSEPDRCGNRDRFVDVKAFIPSIMLNRYIDREEFNIMLQSCFEDCYDRAVVLAAIGSMKYENSVQVDDDGVTQNVTSKAGVVMVETKSIPNPVTLAPFRTFLEVEQPASPFVLRLSDNGNVGLFEADGGAWKNEAMDSIRCYIRENLKDDEFKEKIHVIA